VHVEPLAGLDARVRGIRLDASPALPAQLIDLVVVRATVVSSQSVDPALAFSPG
jgi:hypothetical protein